MGEEKEVMGGGRVWGPDPAAPAPVVIGVEGWGTSLLQQVERVGKSLGVPMQAVRGDRVLSMEHVLVARWHMQRALGVGRSRLQDPGVAFLCFLSAKRQIKQALEELGVPFDRPGEVPVLLVALGDVDLARCMDALRSVGLEPVELQNGKRPGHDVMGRSAGRYWDRRLGLEEGTPDVTRRDRLLAKMALVSLEA